MIRSQFAVVVSKQGDLQKGNFQRRGVRRVEFESATGANIIMDTVHVQYLFRIGNRQPVAGCRFGFSLESPTESAIRI